MEETGLLNSIFSSAINIDKGRKGLRTNGEEHEGRLLYEEGIADALNAFSNVVSTADTKIIMLAEEAFIEQELRFCNENENDTINSLTQALQSFERAFFCLETVEDIETYKKAENTWPYSTKYRIQGLPKDAFHYACFSHRTRLKNIIRSPGINMIEKTVLEQRAANMNTAQTIYIKKQKQALIN